MVTFKNGQKVVRNVFPQTNGYTKHLVSSIVLALFIFANFFGKSFKGLNISIEHAISRKFLFMTTFYYYRDKSGQPFFSAISFCLKF